MILPSISSLTTLPDFTAALATLFEPVPVLAAALFDKKVASYDQLIDAAADLLLNQENQILSHQDKISILDAHPRLGAPKESLSALSYAEQGYNKSNSNNDNNNKEDDHHFQNVLDQLAHWNAEYEKKHGFKFVLFVNGRSRAEILPIIQVRFNNPTHVEMTTGLRDMCDIARDRLNKLNG